MDHKKTLQSYITYLIAFCIIMDGTVMYNYITTFRIGNNIFKLGYLVLCLFVFLHKDIPVKAILGAFWFSVFVLIYICATRYNIQGAIVGFWLPFFVFFLYACGLVKDNEVKDLLYAYANIMVVIALISMVFWFFGSILSLVPGKIPLMYKWGYEDQFTRMTSTYGFLYFENPAQAIDVMGHTIFRNTGIFVEAPGYATYLIYALCIEVFYKTKKNKAHILILALAMVTTLSGKSLISLILIFVLYYLFYYRSIINSAAKAVVSIVSIIAGAIGANYVLSQKLETSSGAARWDHFRSSLITWIQHPFFFFFFYNNPAIHDNFESSITPKGMSMGFTTLLAYGGIYFMIFYAAVIFLLLNSRYTRPYKKGIVLFSCIAFFDLFISAIGYSSHFLMIIALGYASALIKRDVSPYGYSFSREDDCYEG